MTAASPGLIPRLPGRAWARFKDFCAVGGSSTYLWPSWLLLRGVGLVYVLMFAGIILEGQALVGPGGVAPARDFMASMSKQCANPVEAFLRAPSLLWISPSAGMVAALGWLGMIAAVAVVLNLWPRVAMFAAWLLFLSFATMGDFFSATAPDPLMLEVGLLSVLLAPPGMLPGWFPKIAPRRIAIFALRWMLFRLMLEAGLSKFVFGNALWRDLTVMDLMYQTAPFPTVLGYWDFQLPHFFHVLEIALTFIAEIPVPFLMIFGGRGWRWFSFWVWLIFQAGIELTNNFGWLQVAAVALGVVLLDDAMIVEAVRWLRLRRIADFMAARVAGLGVRPVPPWARWTLRAAIAVQFAVAMFFYVVSPIRIPIERVPGFIKQPVVLLFGAWRSANAYPLFGNLKSVREVVEFSGSNDGGETWHTYEYRYLVHRVDQMSPYIAPCYPRFEAILQNNMLITTSPVLYQSVAAHLLRRDPQVVKLFRRDPFPDRPPTMVRMSTYRLFFTDARTLRATGRYWRKEYQGEFAPMMLMGENGEIISSE